MSTTMTLEERMSTLSQLLETAGKKKHISGKMTQLDHALQVAQLAKNDGADEETILAAFFHGIGNLGPEPIDARGMARSNYASHVLYANSTSMNDYGGSSALYLRQLGFPNKTCELLEPRVSAKTYVVEADIALKEGGKTAVSLDFPAGSPSNDLLIEQLKLEKWNASVTAMIGTTSDLSQSILQLAKRNMM
ncbi:hypothetical protein GGH93_003743 [Coemansia aciculifera]|nr:hypothetical protein GGH93_003743 [Coemansia aciculifera]